MARRRARRLPLVRHGNPDPVKLSFTKMHARGTSSCSTAIRARCRRSPKRRCVRSPIVTSASAPTSCCSSRSRPSTASISSTGSSIATAARSNTAATRAAVKFVSDRGLTDKRSVRVQVMKGLITLTMQDNGEVVVDMGAPVFTPRRCRSTQRASTAAPRVATRWAARRRRCDALDLDGDDGQPARGAGRRRCRSVSGARRRPADRAPRALPGARERRLHADRVAQQVKLRVYERAAGETLACGTGYRGGRGRHPARPARFAGDRAHARRHADDQLGRRARRSRRADDGQAATTVFEGEIDLPA